MLSSQKKDLFRGILLMGSFMVVLVLLFMPIFKGTTPLHFLDQLYNTISKGSVYYIGQLSEEAGQYRGKTAAVSWSADTATQAGRIAKMLERNGIEVAVEDTKVRFDADLKILMEGVLRDADAMFHNRGSEILQRYEAPEKLVMFDWWKVLKATEKDLTRHKQFGEAKFVYSVLTKAVECSYNYYGIEARDITDQAHLVILSLLFYVLYTVWLGFAILDLLKGVGLKLEEH